MKALILGAGGVGGYLGARMSESGQNPEFLLRPSTARSIRQSGLSLHSQLGDWSGPVSIAEPGNGSFDLIILSCKAFDLAAALDDLRPFTEAGSLILPFLNGVRHIDEVANAFPQSHVLGGVAHIGATLSGPGCIEHLNRLAIFTAGKLPNDSVDLHELEDIFTAISGPKIDVRLANDIHTQMWAKFVFLGTLAACTCLHDADIGSILKSSGGQKLILDTFEEACGIAAIEGFDLPPDNLAQYRSQLTEQGSTATASMLRDMRAGKPTEVEHILGDLVRRADKNSINTPNLLAALQHVRAYELERATA